MKHVKRWSEVTLKGSLVCILLMMVLLTQNVFGVCNPEYIFDGTIEGTFCGDVYVLGTATLQSSAVIPGALYALAGSVLDVYGGTIGNYLEVSGPDTSGSFGAAVVTVYVSSVNAIPGILEPEQEQIFNAGPGTLSFDLVGAYEDGEPLVLPIILDSGAALNLVGNEGPSVIEVIVDIKPDSADNTVNLGSMGVIPVGILSTDVFDATQVDPWSVELKGSAENSSSATVAVRGKGSKLLSSIKDLNGDGVLDLEVKVETENLDPGIAQDGVVILTGQTYEEYGSQEIEGMDTITIVPVE